MEFVFVVPRADLFGDCYPQGWVPFGNGLRREGLVSAAHARGFFVERARAEREPAWKQVIPYTVVVRRSREGAEPEVLLLRRLATGGEARLHGKLSIGVGGHVNPEDATGRASSAHRDAKDPAERPDPIAAGSRRELDEELAVAGSARVRPVGILNDDSNPVGAVHVGLVQVLETEGDVSVRERELLEGRFVSRRELTDLLDQRAEFETWSALLVPHIDQLLALAASTDASTEHPSLPQPA